MVCFAMVHLTGTDRSQLLLLPRHWIIYVGADIPVTKLDYFSLREDSRALIVNG